MAKDAVVVGGGVIGLSIAWQLAKRGAKVAVLERGPIGKEASWAGAGMLPFKQPPNNPAYRQLIALSAELHPKEALLLKEETGLDTGFVQSGEIELALTPEAEATLVDSAESWARAGVAVRQLDAATLAALEPALAKDRVARAQLIEGAPQLRSPWHLRALELACRRLGVELHSSLEVVGLSHEGRRVTGVETLGPKLSASKVIVAAGAWTAVLLARLGVQLPIRPIRGQIALLEARPGLFSKILMIGHRYLVPRQDGRVLVGSTMEHVGFDKNVTAGAIADLLGLACALVPELASAPLEKTWAGFRPGSPDLMPLLGEIPNWSGLLVASGHSRQGLQLAPGTARVIAELALEGRSSIDLQPLSPTRFGPPGAA